MKVNFLRIAFCVSILIFILFLTLWIWNQPKVSMSEAIKIADKSVVLIDGYRVSQINGDLKWSFTFKNPQYALRVVTTNTASGMQTKVYKVIIDAKNKNIIKIIGPN